MNSHDLRHIHECFIFISFRSLEWINWVDPFGRSQTLHSRSRVLTSQVIFGADCIVESKGLLKYMAGLGGRSHFSFGLLAEI